MKSILLATSASLLGYCLLIKTVFIKEELSLIFDLNGKPVSFTKKKKRENNGLKKKKTDDDR